MANESEYTYASQVTLEESGASTADAAFTAADDADLTVSNHFGYPLADFVLACQFATLPTTDAAPINLYRRELNIDSTNDAPAPSADYPKNYVGSFLVDNSVAINTNMYLDLVNVPLTEDCEFFIENATGQTISAGWDLRCTPKAFVPGA